MLSIKNIKAIKNAGVYHDYKCLDQTPECRQYNLVYGFNGSGKTTLSRIFASIQQGGLHTELPAESEFEFELSDGASVTKQEGLDKLQDRLLVFNSDFVDENLRWKEGVANPIFYLGKTQASLAQLLSTTEAEVMSLRAAHDEAEKLRKSKKSEFDTHNRDAARLIAEQLNLGRRYSAGILKTDYESSNYKKEIIPDESAVKQLRSVILQDSPVEKCQPLDYPIASLKNFVIDLEKLLSSSLGELTLDNLRAHSAMLNWVREGFNYHAENDLDECLFCGNEISKERMDALSLAIDDSLERVIEHIAEKKSEISVMRGKLASLRTNIPSVNDIAHELQREGGESIGALKNTIDEGHAYLDIMLELLDKKSSRPNMQVNTEGLLTQKSATEWDRLLLTHVNNLNYVIGEHNKAHDEFGRVQEEARDKLKSHYLTHGQDDYNRLKTEYDEAALKSDGLEKEKTEKENEATELRQKLRQHAPAAEVISELVHNYLGRKDIKIVPHDEGYEIWRNGKLLTGPLSEGEKTAIALCYFISTLEAEGRKKKELIVVVDDPISSLDTKALNYASSMIKSAFTGVGQLFVMTHNLHFMNEIKKWLRNKAKSENPTASMLFLETTQIEGEETRATVVTKMPKLIRDYESEYHYLFHLTMQLGTSPDEQVGFLYLMPNAMRKVLEIFLAFKLPGSDGLTSKVDTMSSRADLGLDPMRIRAIDRLVQVESHADNLSDLLNFSSMTVEETKGAAEALLEFIEKVDPEHFKRMRKLCA